MTKVSQSPRASQQRRSWRGQGAAKKGRKLFPRAAEAEGRLFLYGLHTVELALKNPNRVSLRLLITKNALARLASRFDDPLPVPVEETTPQALDKLLGSEAVHQGVALEVERLAPSQALPAPLPRLILALDQITDPHNVGAILRSAVALGAGAVLMTTRHSPAESGALAKAASGALDLIPVVAVRNLGDALEDLRDKGVLLAGLDSEAPVRLEHAALHAPLCLVLGAEGKGLRQRTQSLCAIKARLDMPGSIKSLNVSNAAALALYIVGKSVLESTS